MSLTSTPKVMRQAGAASDAVSVAGFRGGRFLFGNGTHGVFPPRELEQLLNWLQTWARPTNKKLSLQQPSLERAGDGDRTRDNHVGNVVLYH